MFVLRPVAEKMELVDVPGGRKRHDAPIPLIGGIAMCVGLTFGVSLGDRPDAWTPIALAIYLLVIVGTVDDRFDLTANVRLIAQACAAMLVVFGAGISVLNLGAPLFFDVSLGALSIPFTILLVIALINAFNMVDGLDGLAGGLAFIALSALAYLGIGTPVFTLTVVLVSVIAAFLLFNLPVPFNRHVRAFMGDAGSTLLGLGIASIGIFLSQGAAPKMAPIVGLWLVAVPVFDLFCAVARRVFGGRSPFSPDAGHLHHALVEKGLTRRETLSVMLGIALLCAGGGLLGNALQLSDGGMMIAWLLAGFVYYQVLRHPALLVRVVKSLTRPRDRKPQAEGA
jgi:UDP-GlcNAc:undecaprenyl-phosphate GlcNAc-1-phosphate transferase